MNSNSSPLRGHLALITGATSGIGLATAEALAQRGADLILTGRRAERLLAEKIRIEKVYGVQVTTLEFDVTKREQIESIFKRQDLAGTFSKLSILVNNAGLAKGAEAMPQASLNDWDEMVDTNIKGLLYMTRMCLPYFLKNNRGHIVNLGSVAGRWVYPGGGVYCATKFAVRALSEGLRFDLLGSSVRVTNIEPGMVQTEFSEVRFGGDRERAKAIYQGMTPLSGADIAETIAWCLERPAHVNIQELIIYPTDQASVGPFVHRRT